MQLQVSSASSSASMRCFWVMPIPAASIAARALVASAL
jgi:hypothetical protein